MKALTCEMCNSTDVIKQDGMYVCQSCGTKYTVDEAKKMMIEGTVDVQGTVKVDNSAFVERYLQNARRAKQKEDWKETEKYYNMVGDFFSIINCGIYFLHYPSQYRIQKKRNFNQDK